MDWALHTARWVLGRLPGEELPTLAVEALVHGEDSPTLRLLAAETLPTAVDAGPLFESALRELGVTLPDERAAVMIVARDVARRVIDGHTGVGAGAAQLAMLARDLEPPPPMLRVFIGLESELDDFGDSTRLEYYGEDYCATVRREVEAQIVRACRDLLERNGYQEA